MDINILTVIGKNSLNRESYESERRTFDYNGEWDAHRDFVIAHQTMTGIPAVVIGWIERLYDPERKTDSFIASSGRKNYACGLIHLADFKGSNIPNLVIVKDITAISRRGASNLILHVSLAAALFGGILILLWSIMGTAERQLRSYFVQLRESEGNFNDFFRSMYDMVIVVSMDWEILFINSAVERTLGYREEELYLNASDGSVSSRQEREYPGEYHDHAAG